VHPPAVGGAAQSGVELGDRDVERGVEVGGAGFGADHRAAGHAGDLYTLAVVRLARVALME
jgi:hypothetical protein